ncbi:nudC domain-containing protein 1 [Tetranychus urticae]|uniref:NudC domain-containing protein 1 n=1 Tax=Tetranychus urticae TaxID=32264 RepID=T1K2Q2_TETUR|nr:nudC domain-containing protein 1 [Tetranychus urticae]
MTQTIDLKVNRHLIDSKFETYYLTTQEVDIKSVPLNDPVDELTLEDKQLYSYLHFSAFSRDFNYLFTDPFDDDPICYYIDSIFKIWRIEIDQLKDQITSPVCLFEVTDGGQAKSNDSLTTLLFPSKDIALILFSQCSTEGLGEGILKLLVVSTEDRQSQPATWKVVNSFNLSDETSFGSCWHNDQKTAKKFPCPAKLITANYRSENDYDILEVVILTVNKNNDEKFECVLNLLQLNKLKSEESKESSVWSIQRLHQLTGQSYPSYIEIDHEDKNTHLTIVSEKHFKTSFDSREDEPVNPETKDSNVESDQDKGNMYVFYQNDSEITVDFKLPLDIEANQIKVNFGIDEMEIYIRGERVFKEKLWQEIDRGECTWTLDKSSKDYTKDNVSNLQITLIKKQDDQIWCQLIKGEEQGFQLMTSERSAAFQDLSILASGLSGFDRLKSVSSYIPSLTGNEQCDEVSEDLVLFRYNCHTKNLTHQAFLAGHQWLFSRKFDADHLPCFALRHDIDALIWEPKAKSKFHVEHIATFSALGYVQASKESKKFLNCSPDFDYAFIADSNNHIYIYKQPALCEGVVNRKAGVRPKIAKQKVINLGCEFVKVLGAIAFKGYLVVLSSKKIFSIKVNF